MQHMYNYVSRVEKGLYTSQRKATVHTSSSSSSFGFGNGYTMEITRDSKKIFFFRDRELLNFKIANY